MRDSLRSFQLVLVVLVFAVLLWPIAAAAQGPKLGDPDSIAAWLRLQAIAISWLVTLAWKHVPIVKDWSNRAASWLALLLMIANVFGKGAMAGLAFNLLGVGTAEAATAVDSISTAHKWAIVVANSALSKVLWDGWIKPTVGHWLDRKLGREPQTAH